MDISLNLLVEHIDDHLCERASRDYRADAGLAIDAPPVPPLPEAERRDVFQHTTELVDSPRIDAGKRGRLTLLRRALAVALVEARLFPLAASSEKWWRSPRLTALGRRWSLAEALLELPAVAQPESRAALAAAVDGALEDPDAARRYELAGAAMAELGVTPPAFPELVRGHAPAPRLDEARAVLAATEDAYHDVLAFALRRVDPQLTRRSATLADVERAVLAPWLFEWLRREDLEHAVVRCVSDLGFDPNAEGRITVDSEPRAGKQGRSRVYELRVPGEVRLMLSPGMGFEAYGGWLASWGQALHRAHVTPALPVVERRLGDRAVVDAVGLLFSSFLLCEGWHRRYLRLTAVQAREVARLYGLRQLFELRVDAGRAVVADALARVGPGPALDEEAGALLSRATGVDTAPARALLGVSLLGEPVARLDAWALEAVIHTTLQERFNEDHYRNPATGRWLRQYAAAGQRDDAHEVARQLHPAGLDLAAAARRRIAAMGA